MVGINEKDNNLSFRKNYTRSFYFIRRRYLRVEKKGKNVLPNYRHNGKRGDVLRSELEKNSVEFVDLKNDGSGNGNGNA